MVAKRVNMPSTVRITAPTPSTYVRNNFIKMTAIRQTGVVRLAPAAETETIRRHINAEFASALYFIRCDLKSIIQIEFQRHSDILLN